MTGEQDLPERPAEVAEGAEGGEKLSKKALVCSGPGYFLRIADDQVEEAGEGEGEGREEEATGGSRSCTQSRGRRK